MYIYERTVSDILCVYADVYDNIETEMYVCLSMYVMTYITPFVDDFLQSLTDQGNFDLIIKLKTQIYIWIYTFIHKIICVYIVRHIQLLLTEADSHQNTLIESTQDRPLFVH